MLTTHSPEHIFSNDVNHSFTWKYTLKRWYHAVAEVGGEFFDSTALEYIAQYRV